MAVTVTCIYCHYRERVSEDQAGRWVVCPNCHEAIRVPVPKDSVEEILAPRSRPEPAPAEVAEPLPRQARLGIAALALGSFSILVLCLPVLGNVSPALSGIGLLLGIGGLIDPPRRRTRNSVAFELGGLSLNLAAAGTAVCLVALAVALLPSLVH